MAGFHVNEYLHSVYTPSLRLSFFVRRRDASVTSGVEVRAYLHDVLTDNKILSYPIESLHTTCEYYVMCGMRLLSLLLLDGRVTLLVTGS